jgi:hypothetical protein
MGIALRDCNINSLLNEVGTAAHDKMLNRLICYIFHHLDDCLVGYVGDTAENLHLGVFVDADHGGDVLDVKATSGAVVVLLGPKTFFPLAVLCKKQTSSANGTTEAEIVAMSHILRQEAIPLLQLWELLLGRKVRMELYEDNAGTILVVENGYSPALRHLSKTQKISIDLLHFVCHSEEICNVNKIDTGEQVADVFTKSFGGPQWDHALELLKVERGKTKVISGRVAL